MKDFQGKLKMENYEKMCPNCFWSYQNISLFVSHLIFDDIIMSELTSELPQSIFMITCKI